MQQFAGCSPNHDWFCQPWPPFIYRELGMAKKLTNGDKTNHGWRPCLQTHAPHTRLCASQAITI